jgi:predicted nucleic acid-binding protein
MYLLDTNVVSELRKLKPHQSVVAWIKNTPEDLLHLSAVTIGEIQAGIERTRELDRTKAAEIEEWLESLAQSYNILPADAAVFRRWATLMHRRTDHHLEDALIAATALIRGFTVVTRNVADFKDLEVALLNPFIAK